MMRSAEASGLRRVEAYNVNTGVRGWGSARTPSRMFFRARVPKRAIKQSPTPARPPSRILFHPLSGSCLPPESSLTLFRGHASPGNSPLSMTRLAFPPESSLILFRGLVSPGNSSHSMARPPCRIEQILNENLALHQFCKVRFECAFCKAFGRNPQC